MEPTHNPGDDRPSHAGLIGTGPGAALRAAREQAGLGIAEIAHRTRLEPRIIEALEAEDYQSLAASAFIKGYLRSVARALDMDPVPLVARYSQLEEEQDPKLADFATRSPAQITSSSLIIRSVTVALGLIFILLVAAWWRHNYQAGEKSPEELAALEEEVTAPEPDPGVPLPYAYTIVDHSREPLGPVKTFRHQTDGSAPPADQLPGGDMAEAANIPEPAAVVPRENVTEATPDGNAVSPPVAAPVEASQPAAPTEEKPQERVSDRRVPASPPAASPREEITAARRTIPAETTAPAPRPAPAAPPAPRPQAGGRELVIEGRGESWVEVSDAAGKRLFMGTLKPGQRVVLTGRPPYDMVVGFPPAISATLSGAPVDLSNRPRSGVARYRLGRAEQERP